MATPVTIVDRFGAPITFVPAEGFTGRYAVLEASAVASPLTGTTAETALATIPIPAGMLGTNGMLRVSCDWSTTNSANDKTLRIRLGGLAGTVLTNTAFTTVANAFHRMLIANRGVANAQIATTDRSRATDVVSTYEIFTAAVNTAVNVDLVITGQLESAGETITLENYLVELIVP